uniref:Insulin-like growth factor binding protein 6b n=1 Tax=Hippocampus comes TaxID=109280 RepID=A0A3Q3DHA9_HIPCM
MPRLRNLTGMVFILIVLGASRTGAKRSGPFKVCPGCGDPLAAAAAAARPPREHKLAGSTPLLVQGEPCGVYTLSCAKGLRCIPPPGERSPLQALLQGRGLCVKQIRTGPTERPHPTGEHTHTFLCAPCRKLLNSVLRGLQLTVIQWDRDIYIPNCDTRGFYRQKQCRSSKGMQRGHCWCVDEAGAPVPSRTGEDAVLPCDGE